MQEVEMYQIYLRLLPIFKNGGQGITIHQRPDEHHIRYQDARDLKTWFIPNLILKEIRSIILYRFGFKLKPTQVLWFQAVGAIIFCRLGYNKNQAYLTDLFRNFSAMELEHRYSLIHFRND
jgi:pyridoxine 5-phosphate synthase